MFGWSAEQTTEITMEEVELDTPTVTNSERDVLNLEFVLQQMHAAHKALTSYEANDISPTRWMLETATAMLRSNDGRKKAKVATPVHVL